LTVPEPFINLEIFKRDEDDNVADETKTIEQVRSSVLQNCFGEIQLGVSNGMRNSSGERSDQLARGIRCQMSPGPQALRALRSRTMNIHFTNFARRTDEFDEKEWKRRQKSKKAESENPL
jgi:hypothetical protein